MIGNSKVDEVGQHRLVSFPDFPQKIDDVAWTNEGKYVIVKDFTFISMDTYDDQNQSVAKLQEKRKYYSTDKHIVCTAQQIFIKTASSTLYTMPHITKQNASEIDMVKKQMPGQYQLIYFHQSMSVFALNLRFGRLNVRNLQTDERYRIPLNMSIIGMGDSQSRVILSPVGIIDSGTKEITLFDLKTQETMVVQIPQQLQFDLAKSSFSLLNHNEAVVGVHRKDQFVISLIQLALKGKIRTVAKISDVSAEIGDTSFVTLNKDKKGLVIRIVTATNLEQKLILLNYQTGNVYWEYKISDIDKQEDRRITRLNSRVWDYGKRFSKDLTNYLVVLEPSRTQVLECSLFGMKKKLFHLFKKSHLASMYGERMGRMLLNVMI